MSRRRFLGYGLGAGAALALPWTAGVRAASAAVGGKLAKYQQPLPVPGDGIVVASPAGGANTYAFTLREISRQLHPQLPPTPFWAYDDGSGLGGQAGSFGMAVAAQSGTPVRASFTNSLPGTYPDWIPVDTRLTAQPDTVVRAMAHLHGGFVAADSDGNPAVDFDGFGPGETQNVFYTNQLPQMPASLLWFHDHAFGATRLNVFAGLAAAYILRDEFDTGAADNPIGIPGGAYEIPLVIQDRQFNTDGTFLYPRSDIPGVVWIGEYFGDVMLVNGKVWPFLNVEPRLYRFRILNGCNARILNLGLGGARLWQIGAEGGLWDVPVPVKNLVLAPAERADVIADFRPSPGQTLVMKNASPPKPVVTPAPSLSAVMQIRVGTTVTQPGPGTVPASLPGRAAEVTGPVAATRFITLNEVNPETATWSLNLNGLDFEKSTPTETPTAGTVEDWVYVNMTGDTHPMHTHLVTHRGHWPHAIRRRRLPGGRGPRRLRRQRRRNRPHAVRDRPDGAAGPDRARLQGHDQSEPRLLHHHPGQVRAAGRRDRIPDLRLPLPHRRTRGQRHDAPVHRHTLISTPVPRRSRRRGAAALLVEHDRVQCVPNSRFAVMPAQASTLSPPVCKASALAA